MEINTEIYRDNKGTEQEVNIGTSIQDIGKSIGKQIGKYVWKYIGKNQGINRDINRE